MPYINKTYKKLWGPTLRPILESMVDELDVDSIGIVNYLITRIINRWLGKEPTYAKYNAVIGVLECAKLELYRRRVVPYEDKKIEDNGDVY